MKRRIGKLLFAVPFGLVIFLMAGILSRKAKVEEAYDKIRRLPDLVLTDIRGNAFRTGLITSGPLLITFFHPECDHCRYEITSLIGSDLLENQLTVLLVSHAGSREILTFINELEILDTSNLHILQDPDFRMSDLFGVNIMPSNFLYSDSLQLIKVYKGSARSEAMKKYLFGDD